MKQIVSDTVKNAAGQWSQLLPALGIDITTGGHHGPCPACGGKDRFRFDDRDGRGTWLCNQCGAGDGLNLVEKVLEVGAKEAALKVAAMLGTLPASGLPVKAQKSAEEKARAQADAAERAAGLIAAAVARTDNAYLLSKGLDGTRALTLAAGVRCGGVAFQAGDLLVPLTDAEGSVVNVQLINVAGEKRTLPDGRVKGSFHLCGNPDGKTLWLTEGVATGLTVHRLTGQAVYVALSANNLPELARKLRAQYPDALMLLAADNDDNGAGQRKAGEAAKACDGKIALPPEAGDWNDLWQTQGDTAPRALLAAFTQPPAPGPFESVSEADLKGMSASEKAGLLVAHYGNALAVPPVGEEICRYENGAWLVVPQQTLRREIAALFQTARAPFSAAGINSILDTLKLMVPQMGDPARRLIGFRNGVYDTATGTFSPHDRENWLRSVNSVSYTAPKPCESLTEHAPNFWKWLTRAAGRNHDKQERILAALFMVLANRYDWQMFLEVTGPGGSGKSMMAEIGTLLAGKDNTTSASIETLESSRERASVVGYSFITLPDQEKWSGDGAGIKAITGGDAVAIDPKYRDAYSAYIPAVILAVNNNPMRFSDRSGGVSRRRVILPFPETIPPGERDPQLLDKIRLELAVIVRHLMQRFAKPEEARKLLQAQQTSGEALEIKRHADPLVDFCGYLMPLAGPTGLFIGNANIRPLNPKRYLYHAYLSFMESRGHQHPMSLTAFGQAIPQTLKEYEIELLKRKTKNGIQTSLELSDDCESDWLPRCDG